MTPEENKTFLTGSIEEMFNRRNVALARERTMPDFKRHDLCRLFPEVEGADGPEKHMSMLLTAIPDIRMDVVDTIAEGDRVCIRYVAYGTHTGELLGRPGTGKPVRYEGINIYRIVDGKLAESWQCLDAVGLLQQIGALTPDPSAGSK